MATAGTAAAIDVGGAEIGAPSEDAGAHADMRETGMAGGAHSRMQRLLALNLFVLCKCLKVLGNATAVATTAAMLRPLAGNGFNNVLLEIDPPDDLVFRVYNKHASTWSNGNAFGAVERRLQRIAAVA